MSFPSYTTPGVYSLVYIHIYTFTYIIPYGNRQTSETPDIESYCKIYPFITPLNIYKVKNLMSKCMFGKIF